MTTSDQPLPLVPGIGALTPLHTGGFGAVYRGHQRRTDRWVAVKVILSREPEAVRVRRFERECAILEELSDQRNVLQLYDSGYLHGGHPYLVTELCAGGSLAERIARSGPLTVPEAVAIGRRIGAVLRRMHAAGLLHRDVKPGNVLFRSDAEPVLADFGMAVRSGDPDTGPAAASPGHAAPEILAGAAWTSAADVFSLGSTLATALTGTVPAPEVGFTSTPAPAHVPAPLSSLLAEMLSVDPNARPGAAEVVERLTRTAAGARDRPPLGPGAGADAGSGPFRPPAAAPVPAAGGTPDAEPPTQLLADSAASGAAPGPPAGVRRAAAAATPRAGWTTRRTMLAGGVVVVLAVLALVAVHPGWSGSGRSGAAAASSGPIPAASGSSAPGSPAPSVSGTPVSPARSVAGPYGAPGRTPPSGFRWVRAAQGLVVAVPVGWRISALAGTAEQRGVDPADPDRWVQFGGYRPAEPTQLGRVHGYASTPRAGYHEIRLAPMPFGSSPDAVDWEYTYVSGTGTRHAHGRYWRQGGAEYVVYANAPVGQWTGLASVFRVLLSAAQPR